MQVRFETQNFNNVRYNKAVDRVAFQGINLKPATVKEVPGFSKKAMGLLTTALIAMGVNVRYKTGDEELDDYIATQVYKSKHINVPMYSANVVKMHEIHEKLKDYPEVLRRIHLTKNYAGKNPMYHANLEQMKEIHRVFKDDIKTLADIHLSKNKKGKIKAHNASGESLYEIYGVFVDNPEIWRKINLTSNKRGLMPIHYASSGDAKFIIKTLREDAEVLKKMLSEPEKFNSQTRASIKKFLEAMVVYYNNQQKDNIDVAAIQEIAETL